MSPLRQVLSPGVQTTPYVTFAELRGLGVPYRRVHVIRLVRAGKFPCPFQISEQRVAWKLSDIRDWLASRPLAHYAPPPEKRWRAPVQVGADADAAE
jgi:prophage regulatory protein